LLATLIGAAYYARIIGEGGRARSVPILWFAIGFVHPIIRAEKIDAQAKNET